jgi:hypothetical protein
MPRVEYISENSEDIIFEKYPYEREFPEDNMVLNLAPKQVLKSFIYDRQEDNILL